MWAAERVEQKKRRRDAEQRAAREDLIGRVGGSGGGEGRGGAGGLLVLGAQKGSSLKARLRYSRSGPRFRLARTEPPGKAMNIYTLRLISSALCDGDAPAAQPNMADGGPCMRANGLLRSVRRH